MRKLIESTLVSLDGITGSPERWASFDAEATAYIDLISAMPKYVASRSLTYGVGGRGHEPD